MSLAEPANEIVWPTRHVRLAPGALMVGFGGVLPAVICTVSVSWPPNGSETRTETVRVPAVVYVNDGFGTFESPKIPSPSRSQEYDSTSRSASVDDRASNATVSGSGPVVGLAVTRAMGGRLPA